MSAGLSFAVIRRTHDGVQEVRREQKFVLTEERKSVLVCRRKRTREDLVQILALVPEL